MAESAPTRPTASQAPEDVAVVGVEMVDFSIRAPKMTELDQESPREFPPGQQAEKSR